ncbi:hypothetical protein CVU37_01720 [candidate division BRC1 bacterium HGW-BRC1-1]|jgi:hypothetical protein|nr:MAG: hypothetical protein CVU37_01720 [candidate division BRC1 bacterium HGW-BRC1-1]
MNNKHTMVLLVLAVVLVAAAYYYSSSNDAAVRASAPAFRTVSEGVTSSTVARIDIVPAGERAVAIVKRDAVWYTDPEKDQRADKALISGLFGALENRLEGQVVSTNPESFAGYEVTETSGTHLKLSGQDGKVLTDVMVGKAGPGFSTTFVMTPDAKEVVEAEASLSYLVNRPEGWRDMNVFDLRSDAITAVKSEGTSATWALMQDGGKWTMTEPFAREGDADKVQSLLSGIATLKATKYVDTTKNASLESYGLDKPAQTVEISYTMSEGDAPTTVTRKLMIGTAAPGDQMGHYARRDDKDEVFVMPQFNVNQLISKPEELSVLPPVVSDEGTTETVVVEEPTSGTISETEPTTAAM